VATWQHSMCTSFSSKRRPRPKAQPARPEPYQQANYEPPVLAWPIAMGLPGNVAAVHSGRRLHLAAREALQVAAHCNQCVMLLVRHDDEVCP
jgi:hypothetical protein